MLAEWKPAYKRGFAMQAPLAIIGFLLGAAAWWFSGRALFLAGALLMLALAVDSICHDANQYGANGD
jgi:hypothetical protein